MEKYALTIILCTVISGTTIADEAEKGAFGQVRLGYVNTDDNASNLGSLAIGGRLGYKTNTYYGLSGGGTFYTSQPVGGVNNNNLFFDSNNKGYSILGEAYINTELGQTSIKFGRQEIETPFADSNDFGMIPNTYESLMIMNTSLPNTTLLVSHLHRWAGVDVEPEPENFTKLNGTNGVNMLGVIYTPSDKWNAQAWHYNAKDSTNISYLEASMNPFKNLGFGLQYANQNGGNSDGKVWGLIVNFETTYYTLSAAYNDVSNGQVINGYGGFGGGPFFTAAEINSIDGVINQEASALSIEYLGFSKLTLAASYYAFEKTVNELDLVANYEFSENLAADFIYSDLNNDGSVTRVFLNYNF
ncbi:MAG: hypothetical protein DSZ28_05065 [Thiothrix sp.]|nr:MAG: hypothetical protein DSZ28_05065 [Thiothrix sp.]